jgi:hypothetical protein
MCQACITGYPTAHGANQHNNQPWNHVANLGADPDHDWHPAPPAETAAATALNNQFNALQLVRPPDLGMGDFVALNGSGHHFDHQTLVVGGATNDFVDNNVKVTLAGTYEPFIIIDASGIANQQQQQQEITNLDNLFATRLTQAERARIIWYPVGPGNAATVLPAAATQAWAGPPSVDTSDTNLFD